MTTDDRPLLVTGYWSLTTRNSQLTTDNKERKTMGVLDRLSTLIRANINDMLDQAEDPEIMLNQILRDMEGEINKARSQVAEMMAQERIFTDDLKSAQDNSAHMEDRAEQYVRQGNDAMAKEALKRKADADANVSVLQQQLQAQSEMV